MRGKLVVGNWKSNGNLAANAVLLGQLRAVLPAISGVDVAVCVPFPYIAQAQQVLSGSTVAWGAQDVSQFAAGAYTAAVTADMLTDFATKYAIVGHSERRALFAESDSVVPILCVGESLQERESGLAETVIGRQIDAVLSVCGVASLANAVVAYEPVWAIGTGKTASPEQAQAVHAFIRSKIGKLDAVVAAGLKILYGGSVKASNAGELFSQPDIDGGLIGGASLLADDFVAICRAAILRG